MTNSPPPWQAHASVDYDSTMANRCSTLLAEITDDPARRKAILADPRDLLGPRGETPQDIETRMRAINKVRAGADPSTGWATKSGAISGVGG